jgi:hypothetical protein
MRMEGAKMMKDILDDSKDKKRMSKGDAKK